MIRFQIIERTGANLHKTLVDATRAGELRTFVATRRGRRIQHKNLSYPGWMNWSVVDGVINCEVISPRKPPVASGNSSAHSSAVLRIVTRTGSSQSMFNFRSRRRKLAGRRRLESERTRRRT